MRREFRSPSPRVEIQNSTQVNVPLQPGNLPEVEDVLKSAKKQIDHDYVESLLARPTTEPTFIDPNMKYVLYDNGPARAQLEKQMTEEQIKELKNAPGMKVSQTINGIDVEAPFRNSEWWT